MKGVSDDKNSYRLTFHCSQKQKHYKIDLDPEDQINNISNELVAALECTPYEYIELYYSDKQLSKDQTFNMYKIATESQIEIKIQKSDEPIMNSYHDKLQEIKITILAPQIQKKYDITIKMAQNLNDIKENFLSSVGWESSPKIKFTLNQKVLNETDTFQQLGLQDNSTIEAFNETFGGY